MSKADEMFEELGYVKEYEDNTYIIFHNFDEDYVRYIRFCKTYMDICAKEEISMDELKAINEKVKELRMVR